MSFLGEEDRPHTGDSLYRGQNLLSGHVRGGEAGLVRLGQIRWLPPTPARRLLLLPNVTARDSCAPRSLLRLPATARGPAVAVPVFPVRLIGTSSLVHGDSHDIRLRAAVLPKGWKPEADQFEKPRC